MYVQFIGNLFLQMLKGIIIPLVIPSLIAAIGYIMESSTEIKINKNPIYRIHEPFSFREGWTPRYHLLHGHHPAGSHPGRHPGDVHQAGRERR